MFFTIYHTIGYLPPGEQKKTQLCRSELSLENMMLIQNVGHCSDGQVVGNLLSISLWIESNKTIVL